MKILVLGGRSFVALELVRNFGRNGHTVYTAESLRLHPSGWSRYVKKNFYISSPRFSLDVFTRELMDIIHQEAIDIIVPTCEETFYVAYIKNKLLSVRPTLNITCGNFESIALLHDKYACMRFAQELEVQVPPTYSLNTVEDFSQIRKHFNNKSIVLKCRFSRFGTDVIILQPQEQLDLTRIEAEKWLCQGYVSGTAVCSYSFAIDGEVQASVCYRSPFLDGTRRGALTAFSPIKHPSIDKVISKIVRHLDYTGHISFDFIVQDEDVFLIECNPRVTSGIHCLADYDFARIVLGEVRPTTASSAQIRFASFWQHHRWLKNFPDVIFDRYDMVPLVAYSLLAMGFLITAVRRNISPIHATTYDIEWNGETLR